MTLAAVLLGAAAVTLAVGLSTSLGRIQDGLDLTGTVQAHVFSAAACGAAGGAPEASDGALGSGQYLTATQQCTIEAALRAQPATVHQVAEVAILAAVPGLARPVQITAYRGDARWMAHPVISGRWYAAPGQAVVPTGFLTATGTRVGGTVTLTVNHRPVPVRLVGEVFAPGNVAFTDMATLAGAVPGLAPDEYDVGLRPGTPDRAYAAAVTATLGRGFAVVRGGGASCRDCRDLEAFLTVNTAQRIPALRAFFAFTRRRKITLINPAGHLRRSQRKGYAGPLIDHTRQRQLPQRWQRDDTDPRERVVGLLCLIHAASNEDVRMLCIDDIDLDRATVRLRNRRHPVPLDPLTVDAIRACLRQRPTTAVDNRFLLVTHQTRQHNRPCSIGFPVRALTKVGLTPQVLRQTRLSDLAHRADPRMMAEAIGITKEAAAHYIIGNVYRADDAFPSTSDQERQEHNGE